MERKYQKVRCRAMRAEDSEMVRNWRMLPDITRYMNTDPVITLEEQIKWFHRQKENPDNFLWIIEVDDIPVGVLTILDLDKQNQRCSSGLYIAVKEKRSLELAMQLEWSLYDFVFNKLKVNKTFAEIFALNKGLIRLKQMCGSEIEGVLKQHVYKNGEFFDIVIMAIDQNTWREKKTKCKYDQIEFEINE